MVASTPSRRVPRLRPPVSNARRPTAGSGRPTRCRADPICRRRHSRSTHGRAGHRCSAGSLGDVAGAERVHRPGPVGVSFTAVDVGPCARVHDDVGLHSTHHLQHGVAVRHVEGSAVAGHDVVGVANTRTRSWPSAPPAPVISTRIAMDTYRGTPARGLDDGRPVTERLPPTAVVRVPPDRVRDALVELHAREPSPARRGASTSRGRSGDRALDGRARST